MKLRLLIRIAIIVSIVSLCTGIGAYSFLRMNALESQRDFDLYTLVPQEVNAVLETDRLADLVEDINQLHCSKDNHFLHASELFVYLKQYFHTLVGDTPHGLSRQMNKMLISFHEPDTPLNQVLYCSLGAGDYELVQSFVQKYASTTFPSKYFDYEGEEIRIYPLQNGRFLAVYVTSDFLVASFQKRLIEQVIDARRSRKSLMHLSSFRAMRADKNENVTATVYVRMRAVDMGKDTDDARSQTRLGSWAEFDMKFNENAIYCSGISYGTDSTQTFINALRKQKPITGYPGERLPASTFFYNQWAISDLASVFGFTSHQEYARAAYSNYIKSRDEEWMDFLKEYAGESIMACLFQPADTTSKHPYAVMSIPMKDEMHAERRLLKLLYDTPKEDHAPPAPQSEYAYKQYPLAANFRQYMLPRNTMLTQLTGITESALYTHASFHRGYLLLAPDAQSLSAYIDAVEKKEVLDGTSVYQEGIGSLSSYYNFAMMLDMGEMMNQPEAYVRLVPNFFFRQANFFRHFVIAIQFACTDGVVYPNLVLLYKGKKNDAG